MSLFHRKHGNRRTEFVMLDTSRCEACWKCIEVCPKGVFGRISLGPHKHSKIINADGCTGCLACSRVCGDGAITPIAGTKEV